MFPRFFPVLGEGGDMTHSTVHSENGGKRVETTL